MKSLWFVEYTILDTQKAHNTLVEGQDLSLERICSAIKFREQGAQIKQITITRIEDITEIYDIPETVRANQQ